MGLASAPPAFWLIAAAMTACALAFVLPPLLRRRPRAPGRTQSETNLQLHRQALAELDRDVEGGLLQADGRESARQEQFARAEADAVDLPETPARDGRAPVLAIALAIALPALALALYGQFGDPAAMAGDLPRHLEARPRDGRGWVLLARQEFERERYPEAAAAFGRAVAASRRVAEDPAVWCEYADAVGMAQAKRLAGKPAELVARAQSLDAAHPCVLEMAGSVAFERADYASAARHWRDLLGRMRAQDASRRELLAAIDRAERMALMQLR